MKPDYTMEMIIIKIEKKTFHNVQDFISSIILPNGDLFEKLNGFIFRGESSNRYKLIPSALRIENKHNLWRNQSLPINDQSEWEFWQINAEYTLLREFYRLANNNGIKVPKIDMITKNYVNNYPIEHMIRRENYTWLATELVELAALAQHYGIPTRLLDWTFEINVALYFASIGAIKRQLKKTDFNDTMVIWALNSQYIQFLKPTTARIPLNLVVPAYSENPNLNAQKGILTYWEVEMRDSISDAKNFLTGKQTKYVDRTPLDQLLQSYCDNEKSDHIILLYKFEIPIKECKNLYNYVNKMGYGASKLFPGYAGVVKELNEIAYVHEIKL